MSTKASVVATTTKTTAAAANETVLDGVLKIKKEPPSDEIKEFAENTMNELLGWYGFDGVDRLDLSTKTPRLISSVGNNESSTPHGSERRRRRAASLLQQQEQNYKNNNNNNNHCNNNNNINKNNKNTVNCQNSHSSSSTVGVTGLGGNESTTSDHDTRSSRDDDSKSPQSTGKTRLEEKIDMSNCCWCRRPVAENAPEFLTTTDGPRYCSETCFTQSRRASFKKAKTCDWCKHVRHAVSYVDFQDGACQLQFCSDKCLNQYKMQIFCKETQEHLDMNPHLREQGLEAVGNGANLITPDLWLRNCRSRSVSPASTISVSPGPTELTIMPPVLTPLSPPRSTPTISSHKSTHKPVISLAPVSKLMSKSPNIICSRSALKNNRRKRPVRSCVANSAALNTTTHLKNSLQPPQICRDIMGSGKNNTLPFNHNPQPLKSGNSTAFNQYNNSGVADLHISMPTISPMFEQQQQQQQQPQHQATISHAGPTLNARATAIPPGYFATPTHHAVQPSPSSSIHAQTSTGFSPSAVRPPFMPNAAAVASGFMPRFLGFPRGFQPPTPMQMPMNHLPTPDLTCVNALIGAPPPVTVMVPYPIIIPLPIPIPIPLPITDFYKAHRLQETARPNEEQSAQTVLVTVKEEKSTSLEKETVHVEESEEKQNIENVEDMPLDYTKSKDSNSHNELTSIALAAEEDSLLQESETTNQAQEMDINTTYCINTSANAGDEIDIIEENSNEHINGDDNNKQMLPKLKITRLQTKRTLLQAKETAENSRPLRKRKRIIDCDFQKVALKDDENTAGDNHLAVTTTVDSATTKETVCASLLEATAAAV